MLSWELQMPFYLLLSGRVLPFFTAKPVVAVPVALTGFKVFEFFITAFEFLAPPAGVFTLRFACLIGFRQDIHFTTTGRLFLDSLIVHFPPPYFVKGRYKRVIYYFRPAATLAALTVFNMSMVMVMGPTPPGTGVMALAFWLTDSKSTSPASILLPSAVLPISFTPTSMTTTPSLTMSPVMALGFPAATIRISALLVWKAISRVLVWQMVTVALAPGAFWSSILAIGLPTMLLLPTTTTSAPSILVPERINNCWLPAG